MPPTSAAAESYYALATSLRFSSLGKEKRTILITSSVGEEGKTTVTANLAAVLAESGFRVVVVSADLRRPMLGELLHSTETEKGLTSAMLGDRELASCFVSVPLPSGKNIFVLPAGPLPHEPAVLLGSDAFGTVLEQIKRSQADFILIDCAPVLPVSDPVAASRHVDGVIVLALHGETRQNDLAETVDRLKPGRRRHHRRGAQRRPGGAGPLRLLRLLRLPRVPAQGPDPQRFVERVLRRRRREQRPPLACRRRHGVIGSSVR